MDASHAAWWWTEPPRRFPEKPLGMHRPTYYRLFSRAAVGQERSIALEREYLNRHYPGVLNSENVVGSGNLRGDEQDGLGHKTSPCEF